jgi:TATA-box binding protein (TBP) (component of TFIID and TFIIIB)
MLMRSTLRGISYSYDLPISVQSNRPTGFSIQNIVCTEEPEDHNCVLLIFGSGKVVITRCEDSNTAQSALDDLEQTISAV